MYDIKNKTKNSKHKEIIDVYTYTVNQLIFADT